MIYWILAVGCIKNCNTVRLFFRGQVLGIGRDGVLGLILDILLLVQVTTTSREWNKFGLFQHGILAHVGFGLQVFAPETEVPAPKTLTI